MDFDFEFFLLLFTVLTGLIWGGYLFIKRNSDDKIAAKEPVLVEFSRSFFPIVLIVLILRSFIVEPFRIPSGSMMPTLLIGDFILVNKFSYGIRVPAFHNKLVPIGAPERGDIVVFRFPRDPSVDYIKRVVGLPGDRIGYFNKQLFINEKKVKTTSLGRYTGVGKGINMTGSMHALEEFSAEHTHSILKLRGQTGVQGEYVVPEAHYFVMGDNRDNSNDSRFWGTVPEQNLVGRAFLIWMNWDLDNGGIGFDRLGSRLK